MLFRRFERYRNQDEFKAMAESEHGQQQLDTLLSETVNLRAFLNHGVRRLSPTLRSTMLQREKEERSTEFDDLDMVDMDLFDTPPLSVDQGEKLYPRSQKPSFLATFWQLMTGGSPTHAMVA
jgi:hypothetical protein